MLPPTALIVVGLLTPSAGIAGSLLWPLLQKSLKLSNKTVLVTLILLASLVPAYGCLGFLPYFKAKEGENGGEGGRIGSLTTAGELYCLAVYFGGWIHIRARLWIHVVE